MEKVDLRNRSDKPYPPEIARLVIKYDGSPGQAERAIGMSMGLFSKIRNGTHPYTDFVRRRVIVALSEPKQEDVKMSSIKNIPATCPPLLADLVRHKGAKTACFKLLSCSEATFYAVLRGKKDLPLAWIPKIKAELGQSLLGPLAPSMEAPKEQQPQIPPFVPWDGKAKGNFVMEAWGKSKRRVIKNVPQPILDLLAKHGKIAPAAAAAGTSANTLQKWMEGGPSFHDAAQRKIHAAMHGMPAGGSNSMGETFDKYSLGLAIVMLKGATFDRISDIAEILNGRMVFRKNTTSGWILIYKMATDDLPKFKRLALRDANEIVCP